MRSLEVHLVPGLTPRPTDDHLGHWHPTPGEQTGSPRWANHHPWDTSWINPNSRYDEAIVRFVEAIMDASSSTPFLDSIAALDHTYVNVSPRWLSQP